MMSSTRNQRFKKLRSRELHQTVYEMRAATKQSGVESIIGDLRGLETLAINAIISLRGFAFHVVRKRVVDSKKVWCSSEKHINTMV